jgi:hypothetical protein
MTFRCALECPPKGSQVSASSLPRKELDYESLVMEACSLLSETDCRFIMGGFGDESWRLDVAYDLSVVIEQLPSLLTGLRGGVEVEMDFYSQGIERTLRFVPSRRQVSIRCLSRTSWTPSPDVEITSIDELELEFVRLAQDFAASLEAINSEIASVAPFSAWLVGKV